MFKEDLLKGKKVLVTGGGTGLGRSMTERFRALGAEVVICGRREEVLAETCDEINGDGAGPQVTWKGCDIRDPASVEAMVAGPGRSAIGSGSGKLCRAQP